VPTPGSIAEGFALPLAPTLRKRRPGLPQARPRGPVQVAALSCCGKVLACRCHGGHRGGDNSSDKRAFWQHAYVRGNASRQSQFAGVSCYCGRRDLNPQGLSPTGS
jgi:hypothetical protein